MATIASMHTARLTGARVTARHVVAQVHGGGEVAPGSVFRRDDDPAFLNLLVGGLFGYS